jgi:hypothetical protein
MEKMKGDNCTDAMSYEEHGSQEASDKGPHQRSVQHAGHLCCLGDASRVVVFLSLVVFLRKWKRPIGPARSATSLALGFF